MLQVIEQPHRQAVPALLPFGSMECPSHGRRSRSILPTDILMFAFLALAVSAGSRVVTGNEIAIVALTIAWMSAAITRLGELRRGERPAIRLQQLDSRTMAVLIAGTGPWVALGVLQRVSQAFVWPPVEMGPSLRALGVVLAIA